MDLQRNTQPTLKYNNASRQTNHGNTPTITRHEGTPQSWKHTAMDTKTHAKYRGYNRQIDML